MRDYIDIGSSPAEEDCAQVGTPDYQQRARAECTRFIELIRRTLGEEPGSAHLAIKSNPHDFGTYYEVVCYFDDNDEEGMKYAFRCEAEAPVRWDDQPAPPEPPSFLGLPIFAGSTTAKNINIRQCDFCKLAGKDVKPVVDGRTQMGPWAGMCEEHFKQYGMGLGLGYGQRLVD